MPHHGASGAPLTTTAPPDPGLRSDEPPQVVGGAVVVPDRGPGRPGWWTSRPRRGPGPSRSGSGSSRRTPYRSRHRWCSRRCRWSRPPAAVGRAVDGEHLAAVLVAQAQVAAAVERGRPEVVGGAGVAPLDARARRRRWTCSDARAPGRWPRFWMRRAPLGTNRHRLSAVPLSAVLTAWAPWRWSRPGCRAACRCCRCGSCACRRRRRRSVHRWSAVPLSAHCRTRALSAVDMFSTPSTLPLLTLRKRSAVAVDARAPSCGRRCRCRSTAGPGRRRRWTCSGCRAPGRWPR